MNIEDDSTIPTPPLIEKVQYGLTREEKKVLTSHHLWEQQATVSEYGFTVNSGFQCGRCPENSWAVSDSYEFEFSDPEFAVFRAENQCFALNPKTLELARISSAEATVLQNDLLYDNDVTAKTLREKLLSAGWLDEPPEPLVVKDSYLRPALYLDSSSITPDVLSGLSPWLSQLESKTELSVIIDDAQGQHDAASFSQLAQSLQDELSDQRYTLGVRLNVRGLDSAWIALLEKEDFDLVLDFQWGEDIGKRAGNRVDMTLTMENKRYLRRVLDAYVGMVTAQVSALSSDALAVLRLLMGFGFRSIDFTGSWWRCVGGASISQPSTQVVHTLQEVVDLIAARLVEELPVDFPVLSEAWRRLYKKHPRYHYCGAGKSYYAMDGSGQPLACHRLEPAFASRSTPRSWPYPACNECWARHLCGGYCACELGQGHSAPNCAVRRRFYTLAVESFLSLYLRYPHPLRRFCSSPNGLLRVEPTPLPFDTWLLYRSG